MTSEPVIPAPPARPLHVRGVRQPPPRAELTQPELRLAEVLATQVVAGRFSSARTEQLAHLALVRAARGYDPGSGEDLLTHCLPRLRRDLQDMVAARTERTASGRAAAQPSVPRTT